MMQEQEEAKQEREEQNKAIKAIADKMVENQPVINGLAKAKSMVLGAIVTIITGVIIFKLTNP